MGEVWEAVRLKGSGIVVPCAIKLLHADFTRSDREHQLFMEEARIATLLEHSRIVRVTDLGTANDGRPFLIMERVDGVNLRQFLRAARKQSDAPFEIDLASYVVGEVLAALAYAHGRTVGGSDAGVVHSDVTPGNILISSSGEVKLTDFGIARFAAAAAPMSKAVGTPRYMSPEQLRGEPCRATDIYGLGVVLYELLEGGRFLEGLGPDAFRSRVLWGPPPNLSRDDVPDWLDDLCMRMLATQASDRPTAGEARATLLERCPGYLAAEAWLETCYGVLIGRRRSGLTQLIEEDEAVSQTVLLPEQSPESPESPESPPTQVLRDSDANTTAPESTTPPRLLALASVRRLAIISGVLAVLLALVTAALLMELRGEPNTETPQLARVPELKTAAPAEAELEPATPEPAEPTEAEVEVEPAAPEPEAEPDPKPAAAEPEAPPSVTRAKTTPQAKAKPKIGVAFLVETNEEGQIRAGRKTIAVKNRSGYAELPPGRYKVSWRPEGASDWEPHGQVELEDISPNRYKVRLDDGKIVEFGQL